MSDARSHATVAAGFARGLLDFAQSRGVSPAALCARALIDESALRDPDGRIPLARYAALMRAAQELCGDPAVALHLGDSPYADSAIGCMIGGFAESGAEGFALWNRYSRLNVDVDAEDGGERFALTRDGGQLWIVDRRAGANAFPELSELTFSCLVATARRHMGEQHFVRAVHFTHAAPSYRDEYERVFRIPVVFGSERNAMLLGDDSWLTERPPTASRVVLDFVSARADELLDALESNRSTAGRVESALAPMLQTREVTMDAIARTLGLSRQTLFRRLRAEGTTFERVLDTLRHKLALHYLGDRKISVTETAYLVGFSDRAAFSRAFKRWTGCSPRALPVHSAHAGSDPRRLSS
ncbi:MAG TPA: AraC family transcriptional regulator ligand-binding domain-containing protein [Thermoanaerobaculia bacterium]|jgi:AraC-like DNA-binding protein